MHVYTFLTFGNRQPTYKKISSAFDSFLKVKQSKTYIFFSKQKTRKNHTLQNKNYLLS